MILKARRAKECDWTFIEECFKKNAKYLGNWFFVKDSLKKPNHFWFVVSGKAFAHLHFNKKMEKYELKEIATIDHGDGAAGLLLKKMPRNVIAKTDFDNYRAHAFYRKNNFTFMGRAKTKKGKELFVFERFC